jgi:transcriptional regulator with XRE-family HTH domain
MMGHVFEQYRQLEGHSEEQLAKELGCSRDMLRWMALCRRPEESHFEEQATAIATRFQVELLPLVQVLRRVEVMGAIVQHVRDVPEVDRPAMQVAARDDSGDEETGS